MQTSTDFEFPVLEAIQQRRSKRAYSNKKIETEKIKTIFEAARWAPSSMNEQPWVYLYATQDQSELWEKILNALNDSNKVWAKDAYLLVVCLARKNHIRNNAPNVYAKYDLASANAFLCLQATALGLNVHQMGGFDAETARINLNISDTLYEIGVIMAIGYPGEPEVLPEHLKQRELVQRVRFLQQEFVINRSF